MIRKLVIILSFVVVLIISIVGIWYRLESQINEEEIISQPDFDNPKYCQKDDDCVLTTLLENECCFKCEQEAVNKITEQKRRDWQKKNCKDSKKDSDILPCPLVSCAPPLYKKSICANSQCVSIGEKAAESEHFILSCFSDCFLETNSLILNTAEETLKVLQKEFLWIAKVAVKSQYFIEVNPPGISGRSYVDYEKWIAKLTRIYKPTIAHEISHLLVAENFGLEERTPDMLPDAPLFPKGPTWLHEGLAMYLEYRVDDSRRAKDISLLKSTTQFLDKEKFIQGEIGESLKLFYAQSWSFTEFLIEKGGKERLRLMIEEVRKHPRREIICREWYTPPEEPKTCIHSESVIAAFWEESFNRIYKDITPNWDSFYKKWIEYVKQKY